MNPPEISRHNLKTMEDLVLKKYEAIFILDVRKVEDEGNAFSKELADLIGSFGGKMEEAVSMGRHQFASEINKKKSGIYWDFVFTVAPDKILEIKDKYRLDERIIRNMIINFDRPDVVKSAQIE